jgi:hypothetical protein
MNLVDLYIVYCIYILGLSYVSKAAIYGYNNFWLNFYIDVIYTLIEIHNHDHSSFSLSIMFGMPLTIGYYLLQFGQINLPSTI